MVEFNEISLRARISESALAELLATEFGLHTDQIGSEVEFWERLHTPAEVELGMEVHYALSGFQTFLTWCQITELSQIDVLKLAAKASNQFNTDAAIGDFIDLSEEASESFFVVTADGMFFKAFAVSNGDVFELQGAGPRIALSDVLKKLT